MLEVAGRDILLTLLIVWATTGLTLIHVAVLAPRLFRPLRRKTPTPSVPAPEGPTPTLTFLISVYNDGITIGPTIESLLRQSVPPDRILVVNDGSTDGTREVLDSYRSRGVDVLHLPANVGKSRALDAALRHVETDLVAITDADSIVHQDYVKEMLRVFRDPTLAAAAGAVESIPHTWVTASRHLEYMLTVRIDRDAESEMKTIVVLPGVSSTYRTRILRELGFEFDTIAEDFDLTFRMQRAGHKMKMNMRAKVFTSDPPTLHAYYRQLVRWYTDFFLVVKKHRKVFGKRAFGTVELPMLILNATVSSALFFAMPVWLAFRDPAYLIMFFATAIAFDVGLVLVAWRVYKRKDVFWAILSRPFTRAIGRFAYLLAMTRVAVGKPGLAWDKLERRSTEAFLTGARATPAALPLFDPAPARPFAEVSRRAGLALLIVGGLVVPFFSIPLALGLLAAGLALLALRSLEAAYASAAGRGRRVATLVGIELAFLATAALSLQLLPIPVDWPWRLIALATTGQVVFFIMAWPWRAGVPRVALAGQALVLAGSIVLAVTGEMPLAMVAHASGFVLLTFETRARPQRVVPSVA